MRVAATLGPVLAFVASTTLAGIISSRGSENPLSEFPKLKPPPEGLGFLNVDADGVYRSYQANGTVVDAARLSKAQINTWLAIAEDQLSETQFAEKQALFDDVDGMTVPEDQLIEPPEQVKPTDLLAAYSASQQTSHRDDGPLIDRRLAQVNCLATGLYCLGAPQRCKIPGCVCNSVICVTG